MLSFEQLSEEEQTVCSFKHPSHPQLCFCSKFASYSIFLISPVLLAVQPWCCRPRLFLNHPQQHYRVPIWRRGSVQRPHRPHLGVLQAAFSPGEVPGKGGKEMHYNDENNKSESFWGPSCGEILTPYPWEGKRNAIGGETLSERILIIFSCVKQMDWPRYPACTYMGASLIELTRTYFPVEVHRIAQQFHPAELLKMTLCGPSCLIVFIWWFFWT